MYKEDDDTALLALRGGLRGRFRRSLDSMENAFEALQDSLERTTSPAQRAELGRRGRAYNAAHFDRETLLREMAAAGVCDLRKGM